MSEADLLARLITAFGRLGDTVVYGGEAVPPELDDGYDDSPWATPRWKPAATETDPAALSELYARLPGRFPPLYERLVLSYRWLDVQLDGLLVFLANPPGPSLEPLLSRITADPTFVKVLFPRGLIPFGRAGGDRYDPICFDTARRCATTGDCPIAWIEHEAVLCDEMIGDRRELAGSFRTLVETIVSAAAGSL